jgi:2-C-methyl-D-erythritol 4-phosphate cytidylyltransferase
MKLASFYKIFNKLTQQPPFCSAVIVAAGSSQRMGGVDKLFVEINEIPVIVHAILPFQQSRNIHEIVVVVHKNVLKQVSELCEKYKFTKVSKVVIGGSTRSESVLNGLLAVSKKALFAAIHDAARPCVSTAIIEETVSKVKQYKAVAPAVSVTSTLKRVKKELILETVDRENLVDIQTPQVFDVDLIKGALTNVMNKNLNVTDDCMAVELLGANVYITNGSTNNIKITNSDDIIIAQTILSQNMADSEPVA